MLSFVSTSKNREKKYPFQQGIKPSNGSKDKTIHLAFIHTCTISPSTKNKSKKMSDEADKSQN